MTSPSLNEQVARRLGWEPIRCGDTHCIGPMSMRWITPKGDRHSDTIPDYSGSIQAAWEILLHIRQQRFSVRNAFRLAMKEIIPTLNSGVRIDPFYWALFMMDPRAICLAFLKLPEDGK